MKDLVGKTVKVFLKKDDVKSPDFREDKIVIMIENVSVDEWACVRKFIRKNGLRCSDTVTILAAIIREMEITGVSYDQFLAQIRTSIVMNNRKEASSAEPIPQRKKFGRPRKCKICKIMDTDKCYDWASISGKYNKMSDYIRLCRSCRRRFDVMERKLGNKRMDHYLEKMALFTFGF